MVNKFFAFAALTALTGVFAASAMAGCSSSDTTATPDSDGGKDSGPVRPTGDGGDDETSCYDSSLAAQTIFDKIGAGNRCSAADVDQFLADCFTDGTSSDEKCKAFLDGKADCTGCLLGSKDTKEFPALLQVEKGYRVNLYGCLAIELGDEACVKPIVDGYYCSDLTCASCEEGKASTDCTNEALNDTAACGQIVAGKDACFEALDKAYETEEQFNASKCVQNAKSFEELYKAVANQLCVVSRGGDTDAGTDSGSDAQ